MAETITTKDLATALETDPRTLRKFLRSVTDKEAQPGKGSRWSFEKRQIRTYRAQFTKWQAAQAERKAATEVAEEETIEEVD